MAAAAGVCLWAVWRAWGAQTPQLLRVLLAWAVLIVGPGLALVELVAPGRPRTERLLASGGSGLVLAAIAAHTLGLVGSASLFQWLAAAATGYGTWHFAQNQVVPGAPRAAGRAAAIAIGVALAVGTIAYAHRIGTAEDGTLILNGSYDSYDSTYYAAMSAELSSQHLRPRSPFYAGHALTYSFYPQLLMAVVHRDGGIALIDLYCRYAWPLMMTLAALAIVLYMGRAVSWNAGALAATLVLVGSDFSYLFALFFRRAADWDDLLWSNNLLTPGAEMLTFNPWAPALAVLFTGLWYLGEGDERGTRRTALACAGVCAGVLVQFKPFAYAAAIGALGVVGLQERMRRGTWQVAAVGLIAVAVSAPYLAWILRHYVDAQSVLVAGFGYGSVLGTIVPNQLGIARALSRVAESAGPAGGSIAVGVAGLVLLAGGLGMRLLGLPGWLHALGGQGSASWRVLAWMIAAGIASPLVIETRPYHQTFQVFHLSLFILWVFVARDLIERPLAPRRRALAIALVLACAAPSTLHYLQIKWRDAQHPFARVDADELAVAAVLHRTDRDRTIVLTHFPDRPSLLGILAERRVVLGWSRYARLSKPRQVEIDDFFRSKHFTHAEARWLLATTGATHVVEAVGVDRIHPDLLGELTPIIVTASLRLYVVPEHLRGRSSVN